MSSGEESGLESLNQAIDTYEPNQAIDTCEPNQATDTYEPDQAIDTYEPNQAIDTYEPNQSIDTYEPDQARVKGQRRYLESWKFEFPWVGPDPEGGLRAFCLFCRRSLDPRVSTLVSRCVTRLKNSFSVTIVPSFYFYFCSRREPLLTLIVI